MEVQFAHDIGAVCFGSFDAYIEQCCDLLITPAFSDELDDFSFARAEVVGRCGALGVEHHLAKHLDDIGAEKSLAGCHLIEGLVENRKAFRFSDEAIGTCFDHVFDDAGIGECGETEDVYTGNITF